MVGASGAEDAEVQRMGAGIASTVVFHSCAEPLPRFAVRPTTDRHSDNSQGSGAKETTKRLGVRLLKRIELVRILGVGGRAGSALRNRMPVAGVSLGVNATRLAFDPAEEASKEIERADVLRRRRPKTVDRAAPRFSGP
jgi:hypothetical protein